MNECSQDEDSHVLTYSLMDSTLKQVVTIYNQISFTWAYHCL